MKKTLILASTVLALFITGQAAAQSIGPSTLDAAGGSTSLSGNTYEWSVGDMAVISTYTSASLVVTQGTLQPFNIPTGVNVITLDKQLKVYPNPAVNTVLLEYNLDHAGKLDYVLQDITGKTILQRSLTVKIGESKEAINMAALASATYMLNVTYKPSEGPQQIMTFKIIKSNS
ncbi:MAG: hypothetical protein BGO69_05005 [Bacteroidetes bacterium 46-16]|nr:MAG: hypothetical protein BGO69_05005 [Bacteroidetes bacterium 46-16]